MDANWLTWRHRERDLAGLNIVVLFGGPGGEREVSITSGKAILQALQASPVKVQNVQGVEISPDGRWMVKGQSMTAPQAILSLPGDTLFFLGLHGSPGEDGRMQAFLELSGRRYTGSGPMASATCMDKRRAREAVGAAGVSVAPGHLVGREAYASAPDRESLAVRALGPGPWFVKPNCGGSSVAVSKAVDGSSLSTSLQAALEVEPDVLVEQEQAGVEVTCAVIGNRGEHLRCLPIVEIFPRKSHFFDYAEKYTPGGASEICPPQHLGTSAIDLIEATAITAYNSTGCEGYARIDFIVEGDGPPIFLEANTLPGFTPRSLLPLAAAASGVSFEELCLEVCARALCRFDTTPLR